MREKFTPGPYVKDYQGTKGHIKSVSPAFNHTPTICKYGTDAHGNKYSASSIGTEQDEANGHLFAASWDLYQVCDDAHTVLSTLCKIHPDIVTNGDRELIARLSFALKKARGES